MGVTNQWMRIINAYRYAIGVIGDKIWFVKDEDSYNEVQDGKAAGVATFKYIREIDETLPKGKYTIDQLIEKAGLNIAKHCLKQSDIELFDNAMKAFEHWQLKDSIELLEKVTYSSKYLEDYRLEVIDNIKNKN